MIKVLASISLVLPSDIDFIFSSTFLSTAAAISLSVDFYPHLPLFILGPFSSELWVFHHY